MSRFPPPPYMEEGSRGKAVDLLLQFLKDWAAKTNRDASAIVLDQHFGKTGVSWLKTFQVVTGLDPDGGFGPKTRAKAKEFGFDFEEEVQKLDSINHFVQPGGEVLYWSSAIAATPDHAGATNRHRQAWHGN